MRQRYHRVRRKYGRGKTLVAAGGVAANSVLREGLAPGTDRFQVRRPPPALCTDNAAMIAWAGINVCALASTI